MHVVRWGETLASIARRYGTSVTAMIQANGLGNPNRILGGQRLIVPAAGSSPAPAPTGGKWIDVDLSNPRLVAYVGDTAVRSIVVSTGLPRTPTPKGNYAIRYKVKSTTMSGPGYHLTGVPSVMVFISDYSIHGAYWHENFGHPMSHGCVNLPVDRARWLYEWASLGIPVVINA